MGGSDDPDNIEELTIEEHAEAHRQLWLKYGKKADLIAWKMLSGRIEGISEEDRIELSREGHHQFINDPERHEKWRSKIKEKRKFQIITEESKLKRSEKLKGRVFTEEHKEKISASLRNKPRKKLGSWSEELRAKHAQLMAVINGKRKGIAVGPQKEETRQKKSEAAKRQHARNPMKRHRDEKGRFV